MLVQKAIGPLAVSSDAAHRQAVPLELPQVPTLKAEGPKGVEAARFSLAIAEAKEWIQVRSSSIGFTLRTCTLLLRRQLLVLRRLSTLPAASLARYYRADSFWLCSHQDCPCRSAPRTQRLPTNAWCWMQQQWLTLQTWRCDSVDVNAADCIEHSNTDGLSS